MAPNAGLSRLAKTKSQTRRFLLEKVLDHNLREVLPQQRTVRPETLAHLRDSMKKNRKPYELLAK